jgi:outer membrane protein OmpA-like peptidoglycan-associated protein
MYAFTSRWRAAAFGAALVAAASTLPVWADNTADPPNAGSKQANIGIATGITVGALAAGPFGAVAGAAAGALLGDRYHREAQTSALLTDTLNKSEAERERLAQNITQLDNSLAQARANGERLDQTLEHTDEVGLDVSFRTDDDSVLAQSMSPLLKIGALVASMPQARVRIDGYTDARGSDAWNEALSLRRAQNVAAVLAAAGVPRERLLVQAHGKHQAASADGDLDGYALERRVTVRLQLDGDSENSQVARRD